MPFTRWLFVACCLATAQASASSVEIFAKGSASKSYIAKDNWTVSVSATTGIGVTLFGGVRLEARYTNISALQNKLEVASESVTITLTDIKTQTSIYSLGLDIDFLGEKSPFQPFIFVGVGYVDTERSYYYQVSGESTAPFFREPKKLGISGNLGLGFRIRIARAVAIELEVFGYGVDIDKPSPLVNLYGTAGIRLFL